jgi:chemotaxis family two-component system response regulator Rcp1
MVLEILLVEDNEAEAYLVRKALELWRTPYNLHVTSSAEEALEFINRQNGHANAPRPHLTLLDLNLPKQPGFVVLQAIKDDPELRGIAVMVLSSSVHPKDVQKALNLHANAYLQKPLDYKVVERLFESLEAFWRLDARFVIKQ